MIVTTSAGVAELCHKLSDSPFITIDTEFLREDLLPQALPRATQRAGQKRRRDRPAFQGYRPFTAVRPDRQQEGSQGLSRGAAGSGNLYNLTGGVVAPFFDTQIAAMVCGYGDSVGYNSLVQDIAKKSIDKARSSWTGRTDL